MKKKISITQIVRHVVQIIGFVLFPGLFILIYSSIKGIVMSLIAGTFSLAANGADLAVVTAVIPITVIFGRFFCGYLCSFGAMGDLVYFLSGLVFKKRRRISARADRALKWVKYAVLLLLVIFVWLLGIKIISFFDPWYVFGVYSRLEGYSSVEALLSIGGALLLLIIVGSCFVERFFCRYFCPLGALFALISKIRVFRFRRTEEKCVSCGLCDKKCSMGIEISKLQKVKSGECIDCMRCAEACGCGALASNAVPLAAGTACAAAITGLYYVGRIAADGIKIQPETPVIAEESGIAKGEYKDGVYKGKAEGYKGTTEVSVTVENGFITDIEIISTKDDPEFFAKAKNSVVKAMISSQSTDVSAVSGATFSSEGIINAVKNALSGDDPGYIFEGSSETSSEESSEASSEASSEESDDESFDGSISQGGDISELPDGVYSGTGNGFRGSITVDVTVSGGRITDIDVTSYNDDYKYFSRAEGTIIESIITEQSADVDAVSGATFSSRGIMQAVADALNISFDAPSAGEQPGTNGGGHGSHGNHGGHGRA